MLRTTLLQSVRCASRVAVRPQVIVTRRIAPLSYVALSRGPSPSIRSLGARFYSAPAGLSKDEVEGRILDILRNFDKVQDASKLSESSNFAKDLGLDSLDIVEVVMAIEEEFSIEIPDKEADRIQSIDKAVEYILSQPDSQ